VGGAVSGLTSTVELQNNGTNLTAISTDGDFTFSTLINEGSTYSVTVQTQPADQTCTVVNGSGNVESANVSNIMVTCSTNAYTVGGTVAGLNGSVALQNNGTDSITINTDGSFVFPTSIAQGSTYSVTVQTQPAIQTCSVSNGSGTMGGADVTNVTVTCSTNTFTVGGTVAGLNGSVALQNNGVDSITINTDGSFVFPTSIAQGSAYSVTVQTQPANQTCTVSNGSGTITSNVTNVGVSCLSNNTSITVSSTGTIPVNSGSGTLTVTNTGTFTANNVSATLPSSWVNVTQTSTGCATIAPGGTCQLSFVSTKPYVAQGNITVTGDNITSPPTTALAFSMNGYLVWSINSATSASVIDSSNLTSIRWGAQGLITGAQSLTNGFENTGIIHGTSGIGASAAVNCFNSTAGGASVGDWYLPAICQVGGANQGAGCSSGLANIDTNLVQLGFGGLFVGPSSSNNYWSSTERATISADNAWYEGFVSSGTSAQSVVGKDASLRVRCARAVTYP